MSEQKCEQNKRFLRALPAGRISHFTSRIYPSLAVGGQARENGQPVAKRGKMCSRWPSAGKCAAGGQARENVQSVAKRGKMRSPWPKSGKRAAGDQAQENGKWYKVQEKRS